MWNAVGAGGGSRAGGRGNLCGSVSLAALNHRGGEYDLPLCRWSKRTAIKVVGRRQRVSLTRRTCFRSARRSSYSDCADQAAQLGSEGPPGIPSIRPPATSEARPIALPACTPCANRLHSQPLRDRDDRVFTGVRLPGRRGAIEGEPVRLGDRIYKSIGPRNYTCGPPGAIADLPDVLRVTPASLPDFSCCSAQPACRRPSMKVGLTYRTGDSLVHSRIRPPQAASSYGTRKVTPVARATFAKGVAKAAEGHKTSGPS